MTPVAELRVAAGLTLRAARRERVSALLRWSLAIGVPALLIALAVTEEGPEAYVEVASSVNVVVALVLIFLLGGGFVQNDFDRGHVALWFQKPVEPVRFYLIKYGTTLALVTVGLLVVFIIAALLSVAVGGGVRPFLGSLLSGLLYAIQLLAVAFFVSAAGVRRDADLTLVVFGVALLQPLIFGGLAVAVQDLIHFVLPRVTEVRFVVRAWEDGSYAESLRFLPAVLGYPLALLLGAAALIHRRLALAWWRPRTRVGRIR